MEITPELLSEIKNIIPVNCAVYRINGTTVENLYFSERLPSILGMSAEEYTETISANASNIVYKEDLPALMDAVRTCIRTGKELDQRYRVAHKGQGTDWVHAVARICGTLDGCPVMIAEFSNASVDEEELNHELVHTKNMYELAAESANFGVWEYDIKRHTIKASSHSFRKFGIADEVGNIPQSILPLFPESEQDKLITMYRRIEAGEPKVSEDFWMRWDPEMPLRCEHVIYSVVKDEQGIPAFAYGIGINISDQQYALVNYNRSLEELLKLNPKALCSFRLNLTENRCESGHGSSTAIQRLLEGDTADVLFSNIASLITEQQDMELFTAQFNRTRLLEDFSSGKTTLSLKYHRKVDNGAEHCVMTSLNMLKNPETGSIEAVVYSVDNEQEETENAIIESIISTEYDYIALITLSSRKICFQHIAEDIHIPVMLGLDDYDTVSGRTLASEVLPEDTDSCIRSTSLDTVIHALAEKDEYIFSFQCRDANGSMFRKQLSYRYLNQKKDRIILLRSDITESFRQEQERNNQMQQALLKAKHADDMKTTFLSNLSHDMRTPLNAVLGYTGLALKAKDAYEMSEYLVKIEKAGNMLLSLINDTLDLSKIESGVITLKPSPISCGDMIQRIITAVKPAMDAKHIIFTLDNTHAVMATINIDVLRVHEIFVNLFSNAVKFTPSGGSITLTVECMKLEKNCVHDKITLSDTGCGMSREFIPHLFEPFSQERTDRNANIGGSGLGLSIVKRLVEMMHGTIDVQSELGKGTTFTVCLGFERMDDKLNKKKEELIAEENINGLHVLLCEDNEMNTEIAKNLLEMHGVSVTCAKNGSDGCSMFKSAEPGTFDAVLMDIRMPVLGGYDAAQKIRASGHADAARIPIIAMSADAYDDDVKKSLDAGMNGHISKPVNPSKLFGELSRLCRKQC